jgi:titin
MNNTFTRSTCLLAWLLSCTLLLCSVPIHAAVPKEPTGLTALAVSPNQITLAWLDASLDETGFELEQSTDGTKFTKIADVGANTLIYQKTALTASTKYWYRIRAKNASGVSAYSNVAIATTLPPLVTIPKAPSSLVAAVVSGTQINLTWIDNSDDETGFELEQSADGTKFTKIADLAANIKSYQNTGLDPATKYWYRVLAKNSAGKSAYSNISTATTLQIAPAAPGNLAATSISTAQINLLWADLSNNETSFQVERSLNGTAFSKIADLGPNVTTFQNTGLSAATEYQYRVRAVNAAGASAYSNVSSAKTQNIPVPDAPINFTAVPTAPDLIQLRWSAVTGNATEVVIERAKGSDEHFVQIRRQAASVLQYEDKQALETADYYYRIKAINAGGDSPYSLIAIVRASSIITAAEPVSVANQVYSTGRALVIELQRQGGGQLSVYDLSGVVRKSIQVDQSSRIGLEQFAPGVYIAVIRTDKEVISKRILLY